MYARSECVVHPTHKLFKISKGLLIFKLEKKPPTITPAWLTLYLSHSEISLFIPDATAPAPSVLFDPWNKSIYVSAKLYTRSTFKLTTLILDYVFVIVIVIVIISYHYQLSIDVTSVTHLLIKIM